MAGMPGHRGWGRLRQLPTVSKRWQASYVGPNFRRYNAPTTFARKRDAEKWLDDQRLSIEKGGWIAPPTKSHAKRLRDRRTVNGLQEQLRKARKTLQTARDRIVLLEASSEELTKQLGEVRETLRTVQKRLQAARERAIESIDISQINTMTGESIDIAAVSGCFVYIIRGADDEPLYVGKSINVLGRIAGHFAQGGQLNKPEKRALAVRIQLIRCANTDAMHAMETRLIRLYRPPWNVVGIDLIDEAKSA
jgi:predicted GIY-YIG superfamily endonuclease